MILLGAEIVDEYNRRTTLKKFIRLVESKQSETSRPIGEYYICDRDGYEFLDGEFY